MRANIEQLDNVIRTYPVHNSYITRYGKSSQAVATRQGMVPQQFAPFAPHKLFNPRQGPLLQLFIGADSYPETLHKPGVILKSSVGFQIFTIQNRPRFHAVHRQQAL